MMHAREKWQIGTLAALERVFEHRIEQEARYDNVNYGHADGTGPDVEWLSGIGKAGLPASDIEETLRRDYEEFSDEHGGPTWMHLVREEMAEAFKEKDLDRLEEEVTQFTALGVAWLEDIARRKNSLD